MQSPRSEHEIECMRSIIATLEKMMWLEEASEEMKNMPQIGQ